MLVQQPGKQGHLVAAGPQQCQLPHGGCSNHCFRAIIDSWHSLSVVRVLSPFRTTMHSMLFNCNSYLTFAVCLLCCFIQVQYSLLYRRPETNGVFEACKENGVTLVAYSPMCQGLLTGVLTHVTDGSPTPGSFTQSS